MSDITPATRAVGNSRGRWKAGDDAAEGRSGLSLPVLVIQEERLTHKALQDWIDLFTTVCPKMVEDAAVILEEMLKRPQANR